MLRYLLCKVIGHRPDKPGDPLRRCTRCPAVWCSCGHRWKRKATKMPGDCNCRRPGYLGS